MSMTLGAQLYTVRAFTKTPEMIESTLRKIKDMGFRTIQISGFGPMDPQKLADLVHELDLYVCVTHTPFARLQNDLPAVIREHRLLGCDTIGLGSMPGDYREDADGVDRFLADITPIAHAIKEEGLQFAYHNHNFEFERAADGRLKIDHLFDDTDPGEFHFILDTYWLQMGGVSPSGYIRRAAGRMKVCHFKDFAVTGYTPHFAEVGNGNLDLHECYRACREAGVKDIVIEQDTCPGDPFDSLAVSFKNLKQIAADEEA
ncbi:MAG: sugar phosphate isomerase/epimerase [Firmicutes bacterium]|nr:sugar phosphate isomerase/epimerase [Bacillota bacterium]